MPRYYSDRMRPSANKAAAPGKEKKAGKPPGAPPGKEEGKGAPPIPGGDCDGKERPENAE
ncbi:hypothetical protein [Anaerotruncus sp. 1XD42-93]|uniref:hypothetical protein n=1 Tax=Anaerotruncus sp. 1XD42-93 TaxID=2320853 RepID=UPI000EA09E7C|nr:hypothetical protein [Anaerotruncus sp. 1XD42-93]NBK20262.1 hypothetical protein [Anaerotruncus sp. 1XD42-93]RKJ73012.1 hypothetical protein D7Y41_35225 [Anaerotruncus sp. 1XD22-93]